MKHTLVFLTLLLTISFCLPSTTFAQRVKGSGKVIEQNRNLSDFYKIHVEDGIDVHILQGEKESVTVKADDNLADYIQTEVENGTLFISSNARNIWRNKAFDVYVTIKNLEAISATDGSDVYGLGLLELDDLLIKCSSGSDLEMEIHANTLHCNLRGGSDVKLKGKVQTLIAKTTGGSDLLAKRLDTNKCEIEARGGSDAWVSVHEELDAQAFGASDIHYYGSPKQVYSKAKSGSDIYGN